MEVEVQIKTGANHVTPNINLIFDNTNGYVFFDKVELKTLNEEYITICVFKR